ncbi:MAG TPA: DUF6348 family protein [Rhodanobacter sp.]|nr:DUF6348 family protein [Rhodanobacter sp.]
MDSSALQKYLVQLFARHAVELVRGDGGWLATRDRYPAIRATWRAGVEDVGGRLDIDVALDAERRIEESFAGMGGSESGCRDALRAFEHNLLHVLLTACWHVTGEHNLRIEAWTIGTRVWDAFIGPFTLRGDEDGALVVPASAMAAIQAAFERETLTTQLHWARLVHGFRADGSVRSEALLDNEPWPAATAALTNVAWPVHERDYTARCCVMLDVPDY